jgi:adenylate kinase family enzyme
MLGADDHLDWVPTRIAIAGVTGSGKSTLARRIASLGYPYTEIDSLFHGPGWTRRAEFEMDVLAIIQSPRWVIEWQYSSARDMIAARADTLIWLDLPWRRVLRQVIARTVRRRGRREELWNGNREGPLWRFLVDRDHIVRWAIRTRHKYRVLVPEAQRQRPDLRVVRLRSHEEVDRWMARLRP